VSFGEDSDMDIMSFEKVRKLVQFRVDPLTVPIDDIDMVRLTGALVRYSR
jgi:hypothetical protein